MAEGKNKPAKGSDKGSEKKANRRGAARLAAVLPSPNRWRADSPGPYVRRRAGTIVQRAQVVRNEHMASCVLALDRVR